MKNIESEKERERGRSIIYMLLEVITTLSKQALAFRGKNHEGENCVELANLLSTHNNEMGHWMKNQNKPNVTNYRRIVAKMN